MTKSALLLAALAGMACSSRPSAPAAPDLVTRGHFEGEIDAATGTFTIRPAAPVVQGGGASGRLVVPEGVSTLGIANPKTGAGSPTKVAGGCGDGVDALEATVIVTLNYPTPQFVGAIHAKITLIDPVTGYEGCNSSPVPTRLTDRYGLWSYGTLRPGAASKPLPWRFKYPSGAAPSRFTGRIVGVPGTTSGVTESRPRPEIPGSTRASSIVYERERMAYLALGTTISYVGLDGAPTGSPIVLPASQGGRSLALPNRAWFLAPFAGLYCGAWSGWFRSVDFVSPNTLSLGPERRIPCTPCASRWPYALAIAPPSAGSGSTDPYWFYVTGNDATSMGGIDYFEAYDATGAFQQDIRALPGYPAACHIPFAPIVGPGNVLWFGGYRDEGYPGSQTYLYDYSFCSYDPATDAFSVVPISTGSDYAGSSGAAAVGPAVGPEGSGSVIWGIDMRPATQRQAARQLIGAANAQFEVEWAPTSGWEPSSLATSPAVNVGGTDHPA
ncbi:MAG: hypothetical protein WB493_01500 [Anaeromyxobacteraceae bacterium]